MRRKKTKDGLTVNLISGTNVVIAGLDLSNTLRKNCLGFAVQREDHVEKEIYWLRGMKTFEATGKDVGPGDMASSREHPFQTFQWYDYTAKPGYEYTYTVIPLYGTPEALEEGGSLSVKISAETHLTENGKHSVFFNRGAVASQEYARRFLNEKPSKVGEPAYKWLSRGLLEAQLAYIERAKGKSYGLYGAVYEFQWPTILEAVKAADKSGAKVRIVYDEIPKDKGPWKKNKDAIAEARVKGLCIARTTGTIMHNKFFVLTKNDKPVSVWTGSTNLTENGIFGHSNCGHIIEDPDVAKQYMKYWEVLADEDGQDLRKWVNSENPAPPDPWDGDNTVIFSPRTGLNALQWYADIAGTAKGGLFMTFAFGMHKFFQEVYERDDKVLKFALMEKEGNGAALEQGKIDIARIRRRANVIVAIGKSITLNSFDRWLKETDRIKSHVNVKWIHTKFMLVDPLGKNPVIVSGSANFSEASTKSNHENMIGLRGDKRAADIYLGEYMRLHSHYAFREAVSFTKDKGQKWNPKNLVTDWREWQEDNFDPKHERFHRRLYFSQNSE